MQREKKTYYKSLVMTKTCFQNYYGGIIQMFGRHLERGKGL